MRRPLPDRSLPPVGRRPPRLVWAGVLAALAGLATPAFAGEKEEARRHFKAGMKLIENGDYDQGIAELRRAYEILPHPNVLYNIARAHAESGDLENAIAAYRRYLADNPPDKEEVEAVVRNLEARLTKSKAAAAAAAQVPTTPVGPAAPVPVAPTAPVPAAPSKKVGAKDLGAEKSADVYEEKVVTASRAEQSPLDSPSSTYVITEQDIRLSGATQIPEVLRRVTGLDFMQITASNFNLSVRGNNQRLSNKLLVLVDGRSIYLDFLGTTFWELNSIAIEDVERIEVVRGPGSALYGADAFSGVVNIITKQPGEGKSGANLVVGSQAGAVASSQHGWLGLTGHAGAWNYRFSANYDYLPRWSREVAKSRIDLGYFSPDGDTGMQMARMDARISRNLTKDVRLGIGTGFGTGYTNFYGIGSFQDAATDTRYGDVTAFVKGSNFGFRTFLNYLSARPGFSTYYLGDPSYRGFAEQQVWDNELTWADAFRTGPLQHAVTVGVGYRFKAIAWNYLADTSYSEHHYNGFAQDAVRIGERLTVVASIRGDYVPFLRRLIPSPRASVIVKPTKQDAVRFTVSSAFRKPSFLESYLDFPVTTPISGAEVPSRGGNVSQEQILTAEIGYQNLASDYFAFDVAAYYNRISDVIALKNSVGMTPSRFAAGEGGYSAATGRFAAAFGGFTNVCSTFDQYGAEVGVRFFPVNGLDVYGSYAYHHNQANNPPGCDAFRADQRTSVHKVNAGAQLRTSAGLSASVEGFYYSDQVWSEQRADFQTGGVEYVNFPLPAYFVLNARVAYRFRAEPIEVGVGATNLTDNLHREHPFGQKIGRRVLVSLGYRF